MSTDLVGNMRNAVFTALSGCIPVPILQINGRTFKRVKLLGEGGFSMVYLVKDEATHRDFALKRIHCPLGTDAVRQAMNEAELYRLFNHPNIVKIMDSCVIQEKSGDKIVYLFLPYYKNGTLQDVINSAVETHTNLPERKMIRMFHGICLAIRELHTYELPNIPISSDEFTSSDNRIPYSHRDIKPGNVLIADDGTPILMDFGSLIRGPVTIRTRQQALLEQVRIYESYYLEILVIRDIYI
ncbi:Serine/threonine-protein kinase env7, variant 2 [Basidiobolus ranarum]|uniref:non-specific serine/threonine protein kinase n=1 Tax=Basidiobolus ranarum TaxID=34480 RepID=A0ABR2W0V1_9FUNG